MKRLGGKVTVPVEMKFATRERDKTRDKRLA